MAGVTERDRKIADRIYYEDPDKDVVASQIAAFRESCVAEERAARLKAEGERDTVAKRLEFFLSVDTAGSGWCGEHPRMYSMRPGEEADGECLACQVEAAEARLRAVIEAADMLVNCAEAHEAHAWHETYRCKEGVCICGLKAMQAHLDDALAACRRVRDAQPASPEPEASPRVHEFAGPDIYHDFQHNHSPTVSIREKCLVCGFTSQAHLCWSCGLPWSQHRERR